MTDLQFINYGSIVMCHPLTDCGDHWLGEHIENPMTLGPAIAIEPRYVPDIVEGARADGLICRGV